MAELRTFVETLGFQDVRTVLQSGNLVFRSEGKRDDAALETLLEDEALKRLGLRTTFLVRSAEEWSEVMARNPFLEMAQDDPSHLVVMFLREPSTPETIENLQAVVVGEERIYLDGRQLYVAFPAGNGDSKLAAVMMGAKFSRFATGRNWNTVSKLDALATT